jgi:hypothetical protein
MRLRRFTATGAWLGSWHFVFRRALQKAIECWDGKDVEPRRVWEVTKGGVQLFEPRSTRPSLPSRRRGQP